MNEYHFSVLICYKHTKLNRYGHWCGLIWVVYNIPWACFGLVASPGCERPKTVTSYHPGISQKLFVSVAQIETRLIDLFSSRSPYIPCIHYSRAK